MTEPVPDDRGYFGPFGGQFVPETLMAALAELDEAGTRTLADPTFVDEYGRLLADWVGRPTPIHHARSLSSGGARVWLKREDLAHTGAHKINNALGQALLARRLGKPRIVAETGAGQHGVAAATAAALTGLACRVYMGALDAERQRPNVKRMELLGAEVERVGGATGTLKDAINEALRDWVTNVRTTHYALGSVVGPHPYPRLVRDFQAVIGREARAQILEREGRLPDALVACVGGGSNSIGAFHAFLDDETALVGVEAEGAASLARGRAGVLHGSRSFVLADDAGQVLDAHSIAPGLDYPGVGPEHAWLKDTGRASYVTVSDGEALAAFHVLARSEGIVPALESAHAVAYAMRLAHTLGRGRIVLVCLSGRGDKDLDLVAGARG